MERSPADVLRLVVAGVGLVVLLIVEWIFGDTLVAFGSDVLRGLAAVPAWIVDVVVLGTRLLAIVVFGGGLLAALWWQRLRLLVTVALGGLVAAALAAGLEALVSPDDGATPVEVGTDLAVVSDSGFPQLTGLAVGIGVLTAAAPWLGRRWRRWAWMLVVGLVLTSFVHAPVSFDTAIGVMSGWVAGAAVLVALGAPSRRPSREAVVEGLAAVGVPMRELDPAGVDARGSTPYFGVDRDGDPLFVKVLAADERSADLLFRIYRSLLPRNFGDERPFSTLRRGVEHEALVAFAASSLGVQTPAVRAFAEVEPNGFVLAYDAVEGSSLDRLEPEQVTDDVLAATWALVGALRRHRIAHRDLRLANIFLGEAADVWLIDFGFAEMAASDLLLATDVAELLASSSVYVGSERALAQARSTVDPDTLARARDRLRPWALSGASRTALKSRPGLLDELRTGLAVPPTAGAPAGAR